MADGRKLPKDYQGLLKYALEYSNTPENGVVADAPRPLDPERREFLENALKSITSDTEEIKKAIELIQDPESSDDDKVNALEVIRDFIAHIDCANNFIKVGGTPVIFKCLTMKNAQIKSNCFYIIAESSQNNPYAQQHYVDAGVFPLLMDNLQEEAAVSTGALHAIASLVNNFPPGLIEFVKIGGIQKVIDCLQLPHARTVAKACFLIRTLATENADVRDKFVELSAIDKLIEFVVPVSEYDTKVEVALSALCALSNSTSGKAQLSQAHVVDKIRNFINSNDNKPECAEMVAYAQSLLQNGRS